MARRDYVVEGAILECTLGTAPGEMIVTSQQKLRINKKLKATNEDKIPKPPFFGSCTCSSPNPPCSPVFKKWKKTSQKSTMGEKNFLMADSQVECEKGGVVTIKDVGQKLAGSGKEEPELDEKYPELQGEIVFANGYLSSSIGGALNAVLDMNPDEPSPNLQRGWNANEDNPLDEKDILLERELEKINAMSPPEIEKDKKQNALVKIPFPVMVYPNISKLIEIPIDIPKVNDTDFKSIDQFSQQDYKDVFWGYWNQIGNLQKGSETYAEYFNAGNNQHFLNGSHGLGSNAAHRMDHGIAQGYHWAKHQWGIIPKEEVDDTKEKVPYIESFSPAYKPLTIVMHSQGNAPGVGFALGAMKYANELGWDQIALNLIFLGVHQPQGLWGKDYKDFIKVRTKHHHADSDFWDTFSKLESFLLKNGTPGDRIAVVLYKYLSNNADHNILKYFNATSELFSSKYHKLRHKRGIYEHLNAITDFSAIKERSVQFTFGNDHADIVCRDGDIPEIDSACNPAIDSTLFSVEFFNKRLSDKNYRKYNDQKKEIFMMNSGRQVVVPPYAAVPRISWEEKNWWEKKEGESDHKKVFHNDYRSIAIDWGKAMDAYKAAKKSYEKAVGRKTTLTDLIIPLKPVYHKAKEETLLRKLNYRYRKVIYHYARIQMADLYAHFSPVEFINDKDILNSQDFGDGLGSENIWERIKKVGEDKFYRVEYEKKSKKVNMISAEAKRKKQKEDVEGKLKTRQIETGIANSSYISNVIKAYVDGDTEAINQLYEEPTLSDEDQNSLNQLLKQFGRTQKFWEDKNLTNKKEQLSKMKEVKKDNTSVKIPSQPSNNN